MRRAGTVILPVQYLTSYCDERPTRVWQQKACILTVGPLGTLLQSKHKLIEQEESNRYSTSPQKCAGSFQKGNYWKGYVICCIIKWNSHTGNLTTGINVGIPLTSSLLEPMLSSAIGLLGALLAVGATSGAELDWGAGDRDKVWGIALFPRVVERYCFTCCLCACWMWYLVGFSKWVCTWSFKQLLGAGGLTHTHTHTVLKI